MGLFLTILSPPEMPQLLADGMDVKTPPLGSDLGQRIGKRRSELTPPGRSQDSVWPETRGA